MSQKVQQQWQFAQRVERELLAKLKDKDALIEDIEHSIHQLRIACESTIFLDFDYATSEKVELHLWDAHITINNRYRKIVGRYKTEEQRKHVVEKRKWEKRYVDFLKTSQFFYKGYVQRLASHYTGMTELRKIAHRLQLSTLSADDRIQVTEDTAHRIFLSCHATLLRLGDLSRYRNVLRTKDRSWEVALAYYGLANDLYPNSGNAFNQMAVISLSEGDHLNAVYHLYRALAIEEPNPMARGNLGIEFKKITNEWTSGGKRPVPGSSSVPSKAGGPAAPVVLWFVRLHAKLYTGQEFSGHDELENEVLSQMTVLLKEQSLEGILDKFVLINIAAEYFAGERLKENVIDENFQSYYFFLKLNVRMLFMLLQLLEPELAGSGDSDDIPDVTGLNLYNSPETVTAVTRRILPALRQYSSWLVSRAPIIVAQVDNAALSIHIREMWSMYSSTLTLLVNAYPPAGLPLIEYLLEEDGATVGFKPLRDSEKCELYTNEAGLKPRITDQGVERSHPNIEMLGRIRELLREGMVIATDDRFPVHMVGGGFRFMEEGLSMTIGTLDESSDIHRAIHDGLSANRSLSPTLSSLPYDNERPRPPSVAPSDSHQSMSNDMYRMVDELVSPNISKVKASQDTSYGMHSGTAAEIFAPLNKIHRPISRHQATSTPFPFSLPGTETSPFSPRPGELTSKSPDRPGTAVRLSSLQLENCRQQLTAASALENSTGYGNESRSAWNGPVAQSGSNKGSTKQQNIGQQLQQSLADQYPSSSEFSHPSSLYQGTPYGGQNRDRLLGPVAYNLTHNTSTTYGGASDFDDLALLQSSIWNGSQRGWGGPLPTPPGGQGG